MNQSAFERICRILDDGGVEYKLFSHAACRTSAESAEARAQAGLPGTTGAKALLLRAELTDGREEYCVAVLPGPTRLNSKALKTRVVNLRKFRFASADEMFRLCGVAPGAMPPFGNAVFHQIGRLFVDSSLLTVEAVGFNAAYLERSIVMRGADYVRVAAPTDIFKLADNAERQP